MQQWERADAHVEIPEGSRNSTDIPEGSLERIL